MMKKCSQLFMLVCVTLYSCNSQIKTQSENTKINNVVEDTTDILNMFNPNHELHIQTFEIYTNKPQKIKGIQGTVITFPSGCFGKEQEKVKIELIECYSIQEMLFNRLSTQTSDGKLLESEGMIYLNALNVKGDTLEIKKGKINIKMPTRKRGEKYHIFEGIRCENKISWTLLPVQIIQFPKMDTIHQEKEFETHRDWSYFLAANEHNFESGTLSKKLKDSLILIGESSNIESNSLPSKNKLELNDKISNEFLVNYVFNITKMGWINCDRFIEGETQDLFVSVGEGQEKVSLYLVLDNLNSNVMPRNRKAINGQFEFRNIPIKETFTLVALATKGDKIYFGMANHATHEGTVNCPELKPVTRQELTDLLLKKFGKDIWSRPLA